MSKFSKHADKVTATVNSHAGEAVTNFMEMNSYKLNPLDTLRIIAASSIFGEPQYYRDGLEAPKAIKNHMTCLEYSIFSAFLKDKRSSADVFTSAIDAALDFDFKSTLELAVELRKEYFMRLNPAVIFVRADRHKNREKFNKDNPGFMRTVGKMIAQRPDDITNQFEYFMFINKSKKGMSSMMKRTWADALESYSRYQLNKYKGKRLIDLVRLSHAHNADIDELMKTGTIKVSETEQTWETMRSTGKTWMQILTTLEVPHMALLRNLRGIFTEIKDTDVAKQVIAKLVEGVPYGKQFPFRYYSAYKVIQEESSVNHKTILLDGLEACLDKSVENMPKLSGKTICLSDNSGSAWGALNSEYGTTRVAEIANLSSLITALQSDEGEVGVFGDNLSIKSISKRNGLLSQLDETCKRGLGQGGGTENGIWIFFRDAIANRKVYDNIFIYSDQQAGHGGLYGTSTGQGEYSTLWGYKNRKSHVDVLALITEYRRTVNPKVNVFSIQVAGYDNSVLPENLYRGAILAGWTGREPVYAKAIIDTWNMIESNSKRTKEIEIATQKNSTKPSSKTRKTKNSTLSSSFDNLKDIIE